MSETAHELWDGRTVMITGGDGFLESCLIEDLETRSEDVEIFVPWIDDYDLREKAHIKRPFEDSGADTVIHLAATVGRIDTNIENLGRYFYNNAIMGIEILEQARLYGVEKFTMLGTICFVFQAHRGPVQRGRPL